MATSVELDFTDNKLFAKSMKELIKGRHWTGIMTMEAELATTSEKRIESSKWICDKHKPEAIMEYAERMTEEDQKQRFARVFQHCRKLSHMISEGELDFTDIESTYMRLLYAQIKNVDDIHKVMIRIEKKLEAAYKMTADTMSKPPEEVQKELKRIQEQVKEGSSDVSIR